MTEPLTFLFNDDGTIPNSRQLYEPERILLRLWNQFLCRRLASLRRHCSVA